MPYLQYQRNTKQDDLNGEAPALEHDSSYPATHPMWLSTANVNATSIRSKALSRQESPSAARGNAGWQWVWRPKPEAVHPENHLRRKPVPSTIDTATYSDHDSFIRTPGYGV